MIFIACVRFAHFLEEMVKGVKRLRLMSQLEFFETFLSAPFETLLLRRETKRHFQIKFHRSIARLLNRLSRIQPAESLVLT